MKNICKQLQERLIDFPESDLPWRVLSDFNSSPWHTSLAQSYPDGLVDREVYYGENVKIQPYVLFSGQVFIGNNVRIGPYTFIRGPVFIGDNSQIGPHCEIARSVIGQDTSISHKNIIIDSVIGDRVMMGGMSSVCNTPIRREYVQATYNTVVEKLWGKYGCCIEDDCKIGCLSIFMPGSHLPSKREIIGTCVVCGSGKITSMTLSKESLPQ